MQLHRVWYNCFIDTRVPALLCVQYNIYKLSNFEIRTFLLKYAQANCTCVSPSIYQYFNSMAYICMMIDDYARYVMFVFYLLHRHIGTVVHTAYHFLHHSQ